MAIGVCRFCYLQPFYCIYYTHHCDLQIQPSQGLPHGYATMDIDYCIIEFVLPEDLDYFSLFGCAQTWWRRRTSTSLSNPTSQACRICITDLWEIGSHPSLIVCCICFKLLHQLKRLLYRRASFRLHATSTTRASPIIISFFHHINHTINNDFPGRALYRLAGQAIQHFEFH
jgi:hypothetical protein